MPIVEMYQRYLRCRNRSGCGCDCGPGCGCAHVHGYGHSCVHSCGRDVSDVSVVVIGVAVAGGTVVVVGVLAMLFVSARLWCQDFL